MSRILVEMLERHFNPSYEMLVKVVDYCPEGIWLERLGGYTFWHQVYHTLYYIDYRFRDEYESGFLQSMKFDSNITPELDRDSPVSLSKEKIKEYMTRIKEKTGNFFERIDDNFLSERLVSDRDFTYLDAILAQVRHIQYHVGHCDSIFRQNGIEAVDWLKYMG